MDSLAFATFSLAGFEYKFSELIMDNKEPVLSKWLMNCSLQQNSVVKGIGCFPP